jgi:phosphopantothenoylcysteine decarboxylase/phosphopantothenate--cysteine ligase
VAKILLGVSGSIAAYKSCELLRLLVRAGHEVVPLVTTAAERFVRAETFFALARRPPAESPYPHLETADLLVVAPLSANTLAKLAHGFADDLLTEAALAHRGPVLVAPAMSPRMWEHPATQANVACLRGRGVEVIGPEEGEVAEGGYGRGRMTEPADIAARVHVLLGQGGRLAGRRVLVSAGGTREPLDAVRFLGNRSSGRMGVALAEEARRRGARVTLLAANLAVPPPAGVEVVETPTAADMAREALARADAEVVLMAAAVADYAPARALAGKRRKDEAPWRLQLVPTVDILRALGAERRDGQVLVGFAADEGEAGLARARAKLAEKRVDLIVFNDIARPGIGFEAPENEVVLIFAGGERHLPRQAKERVAAAVLDAVEELLP